MAKKKGKNVFEDIGDGLSNAFGTNTRYEYRNAGFDKDETRQFMQMANSLASARKRVNADDAAPKFRNQGISESQFNQYDNNPSSNPLWGADHKGRATQKAKDQVQGFISAFRKRQNEVFGRRAQPGIRQTRLT